MYLGDGLPLDVPPENTGLLVIWYCFVVHSMGLSFSADDRPGGRLHHEPWEADGFEGCSGFFDNYQKENPLKKTSLKDFPWFVFF